MYKRQSEINQARNNRATDMSHVCEEETLTDEQKRENLVLLMKKMNEEMKVCTSRRAKELGKLIHETGQQIHALRPKKKAPGVERFFIDAAREILTKAQFDIVMGRAVCLLDESKNKGAL